MGKAPVLSLSSELIRAARALLRWEQRDLSEASAISLPTIKRLESQPGIFGCTPVDNHCAQKGDRNGRGRIHRRKRRWPRGALAKMITKGKK